MKTKRAYNKSGDMIIIKRHESNVWWCGIVRNFDGSVNSLSTLVSFQQARAWFKSQTI